MPEFNFNQMAVFSSNSDYKYQVGGSLAANAPSYVVRQADREFYNGLTAGEFCYVLNSRQMGKSSLRVRMMERLKREGCSCVAIDLTTIGSQNVTPLGWYMGIFFELVSGLGLQGKIDRRKWWKEREALSPVQRLSEFIEQVVLREIEGNIVIFIDEIDSILSLDFSADDFFAFIRACYNLRVDEPEYKRLTFALLGVATPSDFIQDKRRTPFNIGRAIELCGFQLEEVQPLAKGLEGKAFNPETVLSEILQWTGGQPFLTQKLCEIVRSFPCPCSFSSSDTGEKEWIAKIVREQIVENWEAQDNPEHLRTIRSRLFQNEQRLSRLLGLYQQVLEEKGVESSPCLVQRELRLSGLVVKYQGKIIVYNQVYETVFNQAWVEQELTNLRPYAKAINAWQVSHCSEEAWLLRGQVLLEAQAWAKNKSLSDWDYQFLTASQNLENRSIQKDLDAEREAKEILRNAKIEAEKQAAKISIEAKQRADRQIRKANLRLLYSSALAALWGLALFFIFIQLNILKGNLLDIKRASQKAENEFKVVQQELNQEKQKAQNLKEQASLALIEKNKIVVQSQEADLKRQNLERYLFMLKSEGNTLKSTLSQLNTELDTARQQANRERYQKVLIQGELQQAKNQQKQIEQDKENLVLQNKNLEYYAERRELIQVLANFFENGAWFFLGINERHKNSKEPIQSSSEIISPINLTSRVFMIGSRGEKVRHIQRRLRELGYYYDSIDGIFGFNLSSAVERFQAERDMWADGCVGSRTLEALGILNVKDRVNSSYLVVIPGNRETLYEVQTRVALTASLEETQQGTYVNVGQFREGFEAYSIAYQLRSLGFDALVTNKEEASMSIAELQKWLQEKRFYVGSIDGEWSLSTQNAVAQAKQTYNISDKEIHSLVIPRGL